MLKKDLILRFSAGDYDTMTRSIMENNKYKKFIRMAKLSIYSFQKYFDAEFILGFNGENWKRFTDFWEEIEPTLQKPLMIINQHLFENPYPSFFPLGGVWWKWVPFRYDIHRTEISVDTDIIAVSEPTSWYEWLENDSPYLVPEEAIKEIGESTCGDVWRHPVLQNKVALNCGIIGQKSGYDLSNHFFELTNLVDYGTFHGNFVTEQGLFNILFRSLENEGVNVYIFDYEKNPQARHLHDLLNRGKKIETLHWTAKTKLIFNDLFGKIYEWVDGKRKDIDILSDITEWYCLKNISLF